MLLSEIKNLCQNYGIKPSKAYGQNFLIDNNIVDKIISSARLQSSDTVLEIGPGLGVLTERLLADVQTVWAIEKDKKIVQLLQYRFKSEIKAGRLKLIEGDALKINLVEAGLTDFSFKIVCNLPYSITSHFFRQFLETGPKPKEIIVMIQREVAKRLVAQPGSMSLLALSAQFFAKPQILFEVSSSCFWPEPEVVSAVVKLELKKQLPAVEIKTLFRSARIGFAAKRKQLHNNLSGGLKVNDDRIKEILIGLGLREDIRAQDLSVENWIDLTNKLSV